MVAISTTTLRYLNEHAIYFLVKHDIATLDTERTIQFYQHSPKQFPHFTLGLLHHSLIFQSEISSRDGHTYRKTAVSHNVLHILILLYYVFRLMYRTIFRQGSQHTISQDRRH